MQGHSLIAASCLLALNPHLQPCTTNQRQEVILPNAVNWNWGSSQPDFPATFIAHLMWVSSWNWMQILLLRTMIVATIVFFLSDKGDQLLCLFISIRSSHLAECSRSVTGCFGRIEAEMCRVSSYPDGKGLEKRAWASRGAHLLPALSCASDFGFEEEIMTFKRISQAL